MKNKKILSNHGIKPSRLYLPHDKTYIGKHLVDFLSQHFSHIDSQVWQYRFLQGKIFNDKGEILSINSPYIAGQTIFYYREVANEPIIPFEPTILHLDKHLLVVDKPHFLPVIPTGQFVNQTLLAKLRLHPDLQHLNVMDISPLHRLDKDTAGVMLLSVNPSTRGMYQNIFQQKLIHKMYQAIAPIRHDLIFPLEIASRLVRGDQFFLTKTVAGEPNSLTKIELLQNFVENSLYQLTPITGKKHQLRVHMASLGMPLVNDNLYPIAQPTGSTDFAKPLQLLAKSIGFIDPISHQPRKFLSQLQLSMVK